MIEIKIKPLSVNQCWAGRRFKTPAYKNYERYLLHVLPPMDIPEHGPLMILIDFGFSSAASDWDNPIKPLQDILQKRYGFDDKRIKRAIVNVEKVAKGSEYIKFNLYEFDS
jgi:Holliday junction resolvase RusA-like endonuclease